MSNKQAILGPRVLETPFGHDGDVIATELGVDVGQGLSNKTAEQRLKQYGANTIGRETQAPWWRVFLQQFSSIVIWLLLAAALVAWFTNSTAEAVAILIVLLINAVLGFVIEWRAGRALDALSRETRTSARVRRSGREIVVDAAELVIGDIIDLTAGDRVPADARLLETANLQIDESALTGESFPVQKSIESVLFSSILTERSSMLYLGTMVVAGRGLAIVTATGVRTEIGRVGQLIAKTQSEKTPLERRLEALGRTLVYIVLVIGAVILALGVIRGDKPALMVEVAISLAVAAVPEALPAMTTLILALGVLHMARRRAIVRKLAAVETLGSTTVICADKTGTLTENRMAVQEYHLASDEIFQTGSSELRDPLARLLTASILCNDAALGPDSSHAQSVGDPTETALLVGAKRFQMNVAAERSKFDKIHEDPFDAKSKRMIVISRNKSDGRLIASAKGAPSVVLEMCTKFITDDNTAAEFDSLARKRFLAANDEMADRGLRVLALADKTLDDGNDSTAGDYTFLGFAGMSDQPRTGVAEAIKAAQTAGIRVVMLTGDQTLTARAIARDLNLSNDGDIFAMHASEIIGIDDAHLAVAAGRAHVFARVSPEDKLRIVEALQKAGEIVAVTGDGINDAPALKRADIGIAMGMRGTEVAKEAADVVLTDDNFSTIIAAIEGGRAIYANIIKFVHLLFSQNLSEVLVILAAIMIGLPLPLLPLQILWVNLITDVFPAMALAVEPASRTIMKQKPRPPSETLLSNRFLILIGWQGVMLAAITLVAYVWALNSYGEGSHARTVALLALIGVEFGHTFNCRSRTRSAFDGFFRNKYVFAAAAVVILLQILAFYLGPLANVLDLSAPTSNDLLVMLGCVVIPVVVVELVKATARRSHSNS